MPTVPLLASVADLTASVTSGGASQLVPSGVVMAFAGATAPTGWLLCDGSLINRTTYANLFAAIQTAHGSGDGTTTFALPNYAGRFLRGRANGSANDPDRGTRTAAAAGGNTGDNVGSVQVNATKTNGVTVSGTFAASDHNHLNAYGRGGDTVGRFMSFGNPVVSSAMTHNIVTSDEGGQRILGAWTSGSATSEMGLTSAARSTASPSLGAGDAETRPLNAYVNYIIKV